MRTVRLGCQWRISLRFLGEHSAETKLRTNKDQRKKKEKKKKIVRRMSRKKIGLDFPHKFASHEFMSIFIYYNLLVLFSSIDEPRVMSIFRSGSENIFSLSLIALFPI